VQNTVKSLARQDSASTAYFCKDFQIINFLVMSAPKQVMNALRAIMSKAHYFRPVICDRLDVDHAVAFEYEVGDHLE
jgi:hypothetical protein